MKFIGIESQHLLFARYDAIDPELYSSPIVDGCDCVVDVVDAQIGKCEFLKYAVAIV